MKRVLLALSVAVAPLAIVLGTTSAEAAVHFDYAAVASHTNTSVGGQTGTGNGFDDAYSGSIDPSFSISAPSSSIKQTTVKKPKPKTTTIGTAKADSDVVAIFDSPESGVVSFNESGTVNASTAQALPALASAQGEFYYNFTINKASNIFFAYDLTSTGMNADGSAPSQYYQLFSYGPSAIIDSATFTNGAFGSVTNLIAAGSYQLYVGNYYFGAATTAGLNHTGSATTSLSGNYLFDIKTAAVPEPASWALLISGFGMVGAAIRRRRPALAMA